MFRLLLCFCLAGAVCAVCPTASGAAGRMSASAAASATASLDAATWSDVGVGSIRDTVFEMALGAASCAVQSGAVDAPTTLTVIDYSRPSTEKRLWVYDLRTRELLYEELVAHGQGSGDN